MHPATDLIAKLAASTIVALAVALLDAPLFSVTLAWWVCALIGLAVGFGGWFIIVHTHDD
jgi:hypothetical protein